MPGPDASPTAESLAKALLAASLPLRAAELPQVLPTAQFLHRATGLVTAYLEAQDAPR